MTNSGIYCIENLLTGDIYVGSSNKIKRRFSEHKYKLRNYKHTNKYTYSKLSLLYKVSSDTVGNIVRRETWKEEYDERKWD